MTLSEAIAAATRAGFKVRHDPDCGGWVIDTPRRPRQPSVTLASWKTEERAWFAAARFASQLGP